MKKMVRRSSTFDSHFIRTVDHDAALLGQDCYKNADGIITSGTVTITATAVDGSKKKGSVKITITSLVQDGSLEIEGSDEVLVGKTTKLKAVFTQELPPANTKVSWRSDDPTVAKVSSGKVTGVSEGTAVITVCSKENPDICADTTVSVVTELSSSQEYVSDALTAAGASGQTSENAAAETGMETPEGAVPAFEKDDMTLLIGESRKLDVADGHMIIMSAAEPVLTWNEAENSVTGLTEGEVTAYLADIQTVEILDSMTIRVTAEPAENIEETPVMADEDLTGEIDDTEGEGAETQEPAAVVGFEQKELTVTAGESVTLDVSNPDGLAVIVGLSGDTEAVLWDETGNTVTGVRAGDVTAFLSQVDPFEVKDICEIHVVENAEAAVTEETVSEPEEGAGVETEPPAAPVDEEQQTEETAAPEETELPEAVVTVSEQTEEPVTEPAAEEQPVMPEETPASEEETVTLQIRDLDDEGLKGTAGETLWIARDRFEADDELYYSLNYQVENEAVVRLDEQGEGEGLTLRLLAEGQTVLKIRKGDAEDPVLEIRIEVLPAEIPEAAAPETTEAVSEEPMPEPAETLTEEPAADAAEPAEPAAAEEPAEEPAAEQIPEPEPEVIEEPAGEDPAEDAEASE